MALLPSMGALPLRISVNVNACVLVSSTHSQSSSFDMDRVFEAHKFVDKSMRRCYPDEDVACDNVHFPVPRNRITKSSASLLHRLLANCSFTKKTLHLIGKANIPCIVTSAGMWRMLNTFSSFVPFARVREKSCVTRSVVLADRPYGYTTFSLRWAHLDQCALCSGRSQHILPSLL